MANQPKPLIAIPGGQTDEGFDRAAFELYVEFARAVSTCWACSSAIPRGTTRFSVVLHLDRLAHPPDLKDSAGRPRRTMRYSFHTGCLARPVGQEIRRDWNSCFDCGLLPPGRSKTVSEGETGNAVATLADGLMHWSGRCFTGSRATIGVLCDTCQSKPRWEVCVFCTVYFPGWLISNVVSSANNPDINLDVVDDRIRACQFCCDRLNLTRKEDAEARSREFEELREEIKTRGVWTG